VSSVRRVLTTRRLVRRGLRRCACALARLDRDWGKGAVDGILHAWVERFHGGIATTADFIALLRERAPAAYDIDGFLRYARLTP